MDRRMPEITIRSAEYADIPFIIEQHVRVEQTGAPPWRRVGIGSHSGDWIENVICDDPGDQAVFVAVDETGDRLGYTWVLSLTEFDAAEPHGHIAEVGVAVAAQGRGAGRRLIAAAEDWCREHGLTEVTLHCYIGNERAHQLYEHLGFEDEWYRMRKGL